MSGIRWWLQPQAQCPAWCWHWDSLELPTGHFAPRLGVGVRWLWKLGRVESWGEADIGGVNAASLGVLKASFLGGGGNKGKETKTPAGLSLYLGDM